MSCIVGGRGTVCSGRDRVLSGSSRRSTDHATGPRGPEKECLPRASHPSRNDSTYSICRQSRPMQRSCLSRPHLGDVAQVRVMAELIYVRYISMTHLGPSARTASSARYELPELATYAPHRPAPASLSEKAYHLIRDRIVSLRLPPGSMIDERELVADLGLGRTPVREALRRLAGENLVDVFPRRGMFVAGVDVGDLASISEARAELEGFAARLAAARATKEERRVCEELVHELDSSCSRRSSTLTRRVPRRSCAATWSDSRRRSVPSCDTRMSDEGRPRPDRQTNERR
jgi:DNA-binding transcriptional regulator YhcF (GntR family)